MRHRAVFVEGQKINISGHEMTTCRVKKPRRVTRSSKHGSREIGGDNLFNHFLKITHSDEGRVGSSSNNSERKSQGMIDGQEKRSRGGTMSAQRRVVFGWRQCGSGGADERGRGTGVVTNNQ
ncbi:hypothetical protein IMY05_001G0276700 [Salix suchowensis]|nr:hypothetical protein IMY05_001G0276700 [Salix suchowensis]